MVSYRIVLVRPVTSAIALRQLVVRNCAASNRNCIFGCLPGQYHKALRPVSSVTQRTRRNQRKHQKPPTQEIRTGHTEIAYERHGPSDPALCITKMFFHHKHLLVSCHRTSCGWNWCRPGCLAVYPLPLVSILRALRQAGNRSLIMHR